MLFGIINMIGPMGYIIHVGVFNAIVEMQR